MSDLITNGDFEIGSSSTNAPGANASLGLAAGDTTMQGWTVVGGTSNKTLIWAGNGAYGLTAYPGTTDFLDLTGNLDQQPDFGVEQTITTVPGQTYALTFEVGVSLYYDPGVVAVSVMAGNLNTTVTGLAATGTSTWDPVTIDFTATSTASTILIQGDSPGEYIGLDDVAVATTTNAAPPANLVANGSFEQATIPSGSPGAGTGTPLAGGSTAIAGWTVTGTSDLVWIADNASAAQNTPFGDYFLNLAGNHALNYLGGAPYDGVTQTIATVPGTTYQLTFDLGNDNTSANTGLLPTGNGIAEPSGSGAMPGWTVIGGTAVGNDGVAWLSNANSYGLTAETGSYFVSLAGYRDNAPYFGVSQTVATTVGQTYALTFYLGVDNSSVYYTGPIGVSVTAGPATQTIENVSPTGTGNQWVEETVDFTASSASSTISIQGVQGYDYIGLDNISLMQTGNGATGTNLITNGDFAEPSINPVGVSVTAGPVTTTFNNVDPTALGNTWTPETLDFTATSTTSTISFHGDQGQNYIGLDNVVVSTPPATGGGATGGVFSEDGKIDTFTVATSGTYVITAIGATGGGIATGYTGGAGAEVEGTFALTAGDELEILVGGVGSGQDGGAGSGGGGSFVFDATTDTLLEAAGGGGGASVGSGGTGSAGGPGGAGQAGTSGTAGGNYVNGAGTSFGGAGGTAGSGGAAGAFVGGAAGSDSGGGGGGFDSAGGDGAFGNGGASFLAGGAGGIGASLNTQHNGGFGGGGGANSNSIGAGGGGGYSGGGGGEENIGGGGGSFIAPVATNVTLTGGENADGNGSVTIALAAVTPDVFSDQVAASSGPLAGSYLWSDPNNWSAGVPGDGATVTADGSGFDDIASLSLASLNVTAGESYVIANSLTVGTVTASGALTTLFADSGNAPGPVTVTVGAIDTSGTSFGAIGAGSSFIDNSATDPGNSYQAVVGGLVELASLSDASDLQINNGGTIALSNPAASTGALFQDLTAGDVLELPGTSVSNVSFTTNGLTVTTGGPGGGTYAFTNVSYFGTPLSGFTATHDSTTGLEAITFTAADVFTDTEAASSGPLAGSYLWSDPNNWSAGVPGDGATVTADGSGFDDIASLSLASLNVTTGLSYVIANSLTVGTVTARAP